MSKIVAAVRSAAAKARASQYGRYIPNNKVIAGALTGVVGGELSRRGIVAVPPLYVSLGAFAVVSYLFPESPVAAAHVVAKAGSVSIRRVQKFPVSVDVGTSNAYNATKDTLHGVPVATTRAVQFNVPPKA